MWNKKLNKYYLLSFLFEGKEEEIWFYFRIRFIIIFYLNQSILGIPE